MAISLNTSSGFHFRLEMYRQQEIFLEAIQSFPYNSWESIGLLGSFDAIASSKSSNLENTDISDVNSFHLDYVQKY
jgi:hypothetical protein